MSIYPSKRLYNEYRAYLETLRESLKKNRGIYEEEISKIRAENAAICNRNIALANAAFYHGLGKPLVLAALFNGIPERSLEVASLKFQKDTEFQEALAVISRHDRMVRDPTLEQNIYQVTHPSQENFRASVLRVLDLAQNLPHYVDKRNPGVMKEVIEGVYLPFTRLYGLRELHDQLGEAVVRYFHPVDYAVILSQVKLKSQEYGIAQKILLNTAKRLARVYSTRFNRGITVDARPRLKPVYSIFKKKMAGRSDLDIAGIRVIVENKPGEKEDVAVEHLRRFCDELVRRFPHEPRKVTDYIRNPKTNGYQSLHVPFLVGVKGRRVPVEVQLRTQSMNEHAEKGSAAYHVYKGCGYDNILALTHLIRLKRHAGLSDADLHKLIGEPNILVRGLVKQIPGSRPREMLFVVPKGASAADLFFMHGLHREFVDRKKEGEKNDEAGTENTKYELKDFVLYPKDALVRNKGDLTFVKGKLFDPLEPGSLANFVITKEPSITLLERHADLAKNPERQRDLYRYYERHFK